MLTNNFFERRVNKLLGVKQDDKEVMKNQIVYTIYKSKPIKVELKNNPELVNKPKLKCKDLQFKYLAEVCEADVMSSFYSQEIVGRSEAHKKL
jgi:hypothetical protein